MELDGIAEVNVMIGDMVGEVRISAGMGSSRSCWFWFSEWTVASDVGGEVGVLTIGGSVKGGGGLFFVEPRLVWWLWRVYVVLVYFWELWSYCRCPFMAYQQAVPLVLVQANRFASWDA